MFPLITKFINDYQEIKDYLISKSEITMTTTVDDHFRKVFLLSCASYYEKEIQDIIQDFVQDNSNDERVQCFVTNKAIKRQYHTYFNWEGSNVNSFLGLFGSSFKEKVSNEIKNDSKLESYMKSFLNLTDERNKMVHENFLSYKLDKTFDEIMLLNKNAIEFIDYLKIKFKEQI